MRPIARLILALQPVVLFILIGMFWFPYSTRVHALLLYPPILLARWIVHRRLWIRTPLDLPLIALFILASVNHLIAPYTWGWYMSGRIVMGIIIVQILVDLAPTRRALERVLLVTGGIALGVGLLALVTQHYIGKSSVLLSVAQALPVWRGFPGAEGGFNVNEIGGAMAWFAPFVFALLIGEFGARAHRSRVIVYASAFAILVIALALGQSRMAIAGSLFALFGIAVLLIPRRVGKIVVGAAIIGVALLEFGLVIGIFDAATPSGEIGMTTRDEESAAMRVPIWETGLRAALDYPLTGVGLNKFRGDDVRRTYTVPGYASHNPPHVHNELLQVALDMGAPGLIAYIGLHVALAYCLWIAWRRGLRAGALAVAGGIIAHAIFGAADAVTLSDRFIWAFWWLVGLGAALYTQARATPLDSTVPPTGPPPG